MDARLFYCHVADHEDLEWLNSSMGETPDDDGVTVGCSKTGHKFFISLEAIVTSEWETLSDILFGKRQAKIMGHITRIVGYYSNLSNWNPSKIAELRDRHKGDYSILEVGDALTRTTPKKEVARSAGLEPAISKSATLCPIH